jgi:hypothetical protein
MDNETATCAHWDIGRNEWVEDGEVCLQNPNTASQIGLFPTRRASQVLSRTADNLTCSFSHLTSFGGFIGRVVLD